MSDDNRKQNHGRGFGRRAFLQAAAATAGVLAARPAFGTAEVPQERSGEGPYSGDEPSGAHRYLRDAEKFDETAPQPNHTYDAIVVGGGVSGVAAAYRLRDTDFLLIEKDRFLGGASKMETWEGIDYPIGPDFMTAPEKGTELAKFYAELGIDKLWRATSVQEEALFTPAGIVRDFWSSTPQLRRARDFLADLGKNRCPTVPYDPKSSYNGDAFRALDRVSLADWIAAGFGDKKLAFPSEAVDAIDRYSRAGYGATLKELSAWAGLYFFAGDFGGTCVLPGGNARIVREMVDRLEAKTPGRLMTGKMVARIRPAAGGWRVTTVDRRGKAAVLASKTIVVASPKHVVAKMVEGLADDQLRAMSAIHRRAYLVANVLLKRPILRDLYGGYTLGGDDYGDLGVAEWPSRKPTKRSVLTLYRPFCDDISRPQLLVDGFFGAFQSHARDYMLRTFGRQGLKGEDIADVRLARWGHSMIYPSPGQLSDGVYEVAGRPLKGLWFACQDSFGAPCLEAALGAAFQSAAAAKKHLG